MATVKVTADNFADVGSSADTMVIGFSSPGCTPCATFASTFERVSERHRDTVFAAVDIKTQPKLADAFGISSVPTVMIVREQIVLYARPGALPEQALDDLLGKVYETDMDGIRRQIATRRLAASRIRLAADGKGRR